jgi:hypothetical protein
MALLRKAVAHPSITRAQVENAKRRAREGNNAGQNLPLDVAKSTSADGPLSAIAPGKIAIGKRQVVVVVCTSSALRGANVLIVFDEAHEVCCALRQERLPNASTAGHIHFATGAGKGVLIAWQAADQVAALRAAQPNAGAYLTAGSLRLFLGAQ